MSITFNNTVFPAGYVGEDDGTVNATRQTFTPDAISGNSISVSGTVTKVGDAITVTGVLPGGDDTGITTTTTTLVASQYDNSSMIAFYTTDNKFKFLFSNTGNPALVSGTRYQLASDPALVNGSGTDTYVVCFAAGTLILAERDGAQAEIAVEDLRIGDLAVTASGAHRPIRWIGTRAYSGRFANRNPALLPIRFAAGSLGGGLPRRDLLVSPKHAMVLDGMLVPAEMLVNGRSIARVERVESLAYYHVELDSHDVLLAEGAASESYVADNNRGFFHNAADLGAREDREALYCLPRIEHGFALECVRQRLADLCDVDEASVLAA